MSFRFKQFEIEQDDCAMKVGTDGVLLGAWAPGGKRVLDVGTGTGVIALMMAQRCPEAHVVGIDIEPDACRQARSNVAASPFAGRVDILQTSLQDYAQDAVASGEARYDAIVSNPPFFVDSLKNPDGKRALARHTDSLPFGALCRCAQQLLAEDGVFSVILPTDVEDRLMTEAYVCGLRLASRCAVKTVERKQPKRVLLSLVRRRMEGAPIDRVEVMMDAEGNRSAWYAEMTKDFYL